MKRTTFQTGRNILVMVSEIKSGNKKAEYAIFKEITRLENRIKELESGSDTDTYLLPGETEL